MEYTVKDFSAYKTVFKRTVPESYYAEKGGCLFLGDCQQMLRKFKDSSVSLIFADPPYEGGHYEKLLSVLKDISYVTEDTLLVFEADLKRDFGFAKDYGFIVEKEKTYKTNKHVFLRKGVL